MPLCLSQASSSQFPSNSQTSTVQLTSSPWRTHSVSGSQTTSMPFTQSSSQTSSTQVISNLQTSPTQPISGPQISATQSTSAQQTSSTQSTSGSQTRSTSGSHVQNGYTQPHSATMPPTHGTSSLFPVTTPMPSVLGKDIKHLGTGEIAGITSGAFVAVLVVLAALIGLCVCAKRKKFTSKCKLSKTDRHRVGKGEQ